MIDKLLHTNYSSYLNDIKEYSNSMLIGVGKIQDKFNTDALAMLIDSNLNMITQEHYGTQNYDSFNALHILHNSQVAVVGVNTDKNSQESNMWILKLNNDLSIAQISNKSINFYEQLVKLFAQEISENKLRIRQDLSIELLDKKLFFNVSQYKLRDNQKQFLSKFSNKLLNFMYKNKNLIQSFEVDGHTSSEWGQVNFTNTYLKNAELSMKRSYSTLFYIFHKQNKDIKIFLSKVLKGSGFSFSQKIYDIDKKEDKEKSRRVSFKIILK